MKSEKTIWHKEYENWLNSPVLTEEEWKELDAIRDNEDEIKGRFRGPLEFGTAGLRGVMGAGLNRMNIHVVRWATQAFAELIIAEGPDACKRGVAIACDSRNNSQLFAEEAACVCAANGIHVRLFESLRPTPELSFAVRQYHCAAGINVTASHNPKEYNGYKVYWSDGAQLPPQHAAEVARRMGEIDIFKGVSAMKLEDAVQQGLVEYLGAETDELFLKNVMGQAIAPKYVADVADSLKIVYTPFHGAGHLLVPEALRRLGIKHIIPVPEQMVMDGNFPTVASPNPENPEGFALAVELARKEHSELIIGTDPDSDRVGVMALDSDGEYRTITGNQMGALLTDYIITARRENGTLPENAAVLSSIVSTGMTAAICKANNVHFDMTFTGFKFIAEQIGKYEADNSYRYILGFEESYGYMAGDYVRDKDAVTASMLIAEMAAYYYAKGLTLHGAIAALYEKYGYFAEKTINLVMSGTDGPDRMAALMASLRSDPPAELGGRRVMRVRDYKDGTVSVPGLGPVDRTPISGSNVLYMELEDGTCFIVRPSGTEPKIKFYILARGENAQACRQAVEDCTKAAETFG